MQASLKKKWEILYHFSLPLFLIIGLSLFIGSELNLKLPIILTLAVSIFFTALIYLLDLNKARIQTYFVLLTIGFIIILLFSTLKINPINQMRLLFKWLQDYQTDKELYHFSSAFILLILFTGVLSLVSYLLVKWRISQLITAILAISFLLYLGIIGFEIGRGPVLLLLCYISCTVVQCTYYLRNKLGGHLPIGAPIFLIPFSLLTVVLTLIGPIYKEPISWKALSDLVENISNTVEVALYEIEVLGGGSNSQFAINFTGFDTQDRILGEKVIASNEPLLQINTSSTPRNPLYFQGTIKNTYTGSGWSSDNLSELTDYKAYELDYYELLYAFFRSPIATDSQLFNSAEVKITTKALKTKSRFALPRTYIISYTSQSPKKEGINTTFPRMQKSGDSYSLTYFEVNTANSDFTSFIRSLEDYHYTYLPDAPAAPLVAKNFDNNAIFYQVYKSNAVNTSIYNASLENILYNRAAQINELYTNLPSELPQRVYELANEITKDAPTTYDKLKAIETYLRQFSYTTTPMPIPKEEDFVDQFLFETQEGYCTYFATSMCVLARCIGIPTRYIEGFSCSMQKSDKKSYILTPTQAHAWSEAYIEGYGWILFEATPSSPLVNASNWPTASASGNQVYSTYQPDLPEVPPPSTIENIPLVENELPVPLAQRLLHSPIFWFFIVGLLLLIVLFLCYICFSFFQYKRLLGKSSPIEKARLLFIEILFYLELKGYPKQSNESMLDYATRLAPFFSQDSLTPVTLTLTYLSYRYGKHIPSQQELGQLKDFLALLYPKASEKWHLAKSIRQHIQFLLKRNNYSVK